MIWLYGVECRAISLSVIIRMSCVPRKECLEILTLGTWKNYIETTEAARYIAATGLLLKVEFNVWDFVFCGRRRWYVAVDPTVRTEHNTTHTHRPPASFYPCDVMLSFRLFPVPERCTLPAIGASCTFMKNPPKRFRRSDRLMVLRNWGEDGWSFS